MLSWAFMATLCLYIHFNGICKYFILKVTIVKFNIKTQFNHENKFYATAFDVAFIHH